MKAIENIALLVSNFSLLYDWGHIEFLICVLGAYGVNTEPSRCKMGEYRGCICCFREICKCFPVCVSVKIPVNHMKVRWM